MRRSSLTGHVWVFVGRKYDPGGDLDILEASGWSILDIRKLGPQPINLKRLELRTLDLKSVEMKVLRRGVVSFGRVAYLT